MIAINEIRFGNIFQWVDSKERFVFNTDCFTVTLSGMAHLERIEPVILTPELLEKCGFRNDHGEGDRVWKLNDVELFHYEIDETISFYFAGRQKEKILESVHQLQNLYYALTGKELEIDMAQPLISLWKHTP